MKRSWLAPSVVVAVVLLQFSSVMRGRVYRFEDIAAYFEPLWTGVARALSHGRLPLWDDGAWSGYPLIGDPQVGALYPPNWLALGMPVLRAYAVCALLHSAWAGLGMYALCRARARSEAASALGGIALAVGGYVVLQVRHLMFVEATAWFPWVAAAGWTWLEKRQRSALAATAVATGMLLLTGGESMIYYGAGFLVAVLLPRALLAKGGAEDAAQNNLSNVRSIFAGLGGLAGAAALGLFLGAASWLPAAAHGRLSPRALGVDREFAGSVAWSGLHLLPSLFLPNILGQQVRGDYMGGGTQWEIAGYYAGMLAFALAMYALVAGEPRRKSERLALGALFVLAVLVSPGLRSPVHALACRLLPLYGTMRCPSRALYVFSLGVPLLAADGLDLALARVRPSRRSLVAALAVLVAAADLLYFQRAENPSLTLAEAHAQAFPEAVDFLRAHQGERHATDVHLPQPFHNSGVLWGSMSSGGYSSLPIWRYLHYLWIINHGAPYPHAQLHDDLSAQGIWHFSSPLVDALNLRWLLTDAKHPPDGSGWLRRYSGPGLPGGAPQPESLEVWENTEAMPLAWLSHRARVVDGEAAAARAIADKSFDPRVESVVEEPLLPAPELAAGGAALEPVDAFSRVWHGELTFDVHLSAPALLVVSTPYYPTRVATVDGQPARLVPVDYALTGLALPVGAHVIELAITSPALDAGLALTVAAALSLLALTFVGRRRKGHAASSVPVAAGGD